jgi:hypothetical protein
MYDVATSESHDEYIEIFNLSHHDSVDCTGWVFSDSSGDDHVYPYQGGIKIAPRNYALILDGSYFDQSDTYENLFTDSLVILKIGDNSFGKNGLSNSMAELLTLRDSSGNVLTKYTYSLGNRPGFSDEKIDLDEPNEATNWSNSKIKGGTPGRKNSVSPPVYDFGFNDDSFTFPPLMQANESVEYSLKLYEYGTKPINDSLYILIYCDTDRDPLGQSKGRIIDSVIVTASEQLIELEWQNPPAGQHRITAQLYCDFDELAENDKISKDIRILEQNISIRLNEIKFLNDEDEPEWIELINIGKDSVLLFNWAITDLTDTVSIDTEVYIHSGDYIILSEDTLWQNYRLQKEKMIILDKFPTLNDQEDELCILNPFRRLIECVHYNRQWLEGEDYRRPSLERINPQLYGNTSENWGPSIDPAGATPGIKNSIFTDLVHKSLKLTASPNPFSPDNDGFEEVTIISGQIPEYSAKIKLEIYDIRGRLVRNIKDNHFTGSHINIVWDGRDNFGRVARIGIYIIYLQALNDRRGILREIKTSVVLAKRL